MVREFMIGEGIPSTFYMSTGELTPEVEAAWREWQDEFSAAEQRMRKERGWE